MELRRSWIVGLIEAAEKGNRKRQLEAASLAVSNRSNILTLRDLPLTIAEIPPESRRWRRQSEETSRGCKPRLSNPFDFFDHTGSQRQRVRGRFQAPTAPGVCCITRHRDC